MSRPPKLDRIALAELCATDPPISWDTVAERIGFTRRRVLTRAKEWGIRKVPVYPGMRERWIRLQAEASPASTQPEQP